MAIIDKPSDYFNTLLWNGNNSGTTREITGVGFTPDFIWSKRRGTSGSHQLYDTIRGTQNVLQTDSTTAQITSNVYGAITTLGSDGYTWTNGSDGVNPRYYFNESDTYCSWNWKANGSGSLNEVGSIDSTVSANTTSGFSIVSYTGTGSAATIGHGLNAVPSMIIVKVRTGRTSDWLVYHKGIASDAQTDCIKLNETGAAFDEATIWNDTAPTSSVFSVGTEDTVSGSGNTFVAYCFAEKQGYSKFGSYTGNGNADGTFVYTGFKPAFVIQKNTSATQGWQLQDNKRLGYNPDNYLLQPHTSQAESALQRVDLLSNGFKVRTTDAGQNASGNNYIYMCFAENPLVSTAGVPATAR